MVLSSRSLEFKKEKLASIFRFVGLVLATLTSVPQVPCSICYSGSGCTCSVFVIACVVFERGMFVSFKF